MYLEVYKFKDIPNLHCCFDGNFYYKDIPIKKKWRVGQVYIEINKKRYGLNTLRKIAYKSFILEEKLPF